jgi:LysM repeat protein
MQNRLPRPNALIAALIMLQTLMLGAAPARPAAAPAAYISGVVGHAQTYALSCESRSAVDLAAFWGVSISETTFFEALPKSDNPNIGFVGSVHGAWGQVPPNPYGVHAKPVAKTLQKFGLDAAHRYGMTFGQLKDEIAAGRPVIVWVIGGVWSGSAQNYTAKNGDTLTVAAYEHTMIMIGYDESYVYLVNAGNGQTQTHSIANFKNSWSVLGNQAVVVQGGGKAGGGSTTTTTSNTQNQNTSGSNSGGNTGSYVAKSGDYLKKIADQYGMAWTELAALNNIQYPYVIHVGQTLTIKGGGAGGANSGGNNNPPAPQPTATPKPGAQNNQGNQDNPTSSASYTVRSGDHLMAIARTLNVNWLDIANLNGLNSPYVLYAGQVLKLPGGASAPNHTSDNGNSSNSNTDSGGNKNPKTYTVQKGDYLVALAREFGVNWQTLASYNGIHYPWVVHPGQVLNIP